MPIKTLFRNIILISIVLFQGGVITGQLDNTLIKGITVVCPKDSLTHNPFDDIECLGANYACIVPYRNCNLSDFKISETNTFGWYGLDINGVEDMIRLAQDAGLGIMLKPQLYLERSWPGEIDFQTESEWKQWEVSYSKFIFEFLDLAVANDIEIFCIGAELKNSILKRKQFWKRLIRDVRTLYKGKLIYSANWDNYEEVTFWKDLDYIGISSYFPLSKKTSPELPHLMRSWKPIVNRLTYFSKKNERKIVFTEYGYLSVDNAAHQHWINEERIEQLNVNTLAQANAIEALYLSWWKEDVWKGGFLWKWYPAQIGYAEHWDKDYTPQGKQAEQIIKKWFNK